MAILLKKVPENIKEIIMFVQSQVKLERKIGMFSYEKAIYKIISDYKSLKDKYEPSKPEV